MLYIVGTEVFVTAAPQQPPTPGGVNKKVTKRRNTLFPVDKKWQLGRIYKDHDKDKLVYDFYNCNNTNDVINLEFSTSEEADQAIALARGDKIVETSDKYSLTDSDIQDKYDRVSEIQDRRFGNIHSRESRGKR